MYILVPLKQAEIVAPMGIGMLMGDMTQRVTAPVYIWYVEGSERKIIVDAGVGTSKHEDLEVRGGGEKGLRKALEEVGISPKEVEILILTHLHFDHVACVGLFENARIYVQKKEWETALSPLPPLRPFYDQKLLEPLERMDLVLVEGDHEIEKGLTLLHLPGHTEGMQGLAFHTRKGTAVLASDLLYTYLNLHSPFSYTPFYPPAIIVDLREWFWSVGKALRTASSRELVYPGHEPSLEGKRLPEV
ncbi:MAG: N-acyl homoserine lactonase family protein [Candidatus Hadarchaeales archaeon]